MSSITWSTDFDEACRLAKDSGKRVLLDFFSHT
jgi:hypothetical protein